MARTRGLAYFRRVQAEPRTVDRDGFTLLELLVVMAILAGLVAIALPSLNTLVARVRASFQRSDIEQQLRQLPLLVRQSGHSGILADPSQTTVAGSLAGDPTLRAVSEVERAERLKIALPSGWTMHIVKPVFYHFTGVCTGGEVDFSLPPQSFRYILTAPLCRPQLAASHAP